MQSTRKNTRKRSGARKRLTPRKEQHGLSAQEIALPPDAAELRELVEN